MSSEPMSANPIQGDGWIEIGKRCSAGRRSLWARWIYRSEATEEEKKIGARISKLDDVEAIELCAGREGGDSFLRIDRTNPQFLEIEDLLSTARFGATT